MILSKAILLKWAGIIIALVTLIMAVEQGQTQSQPPDSEEGILPLPVPVDQVLSGVIPGLPPGYMIVEKDILVTFEEFEHRYLGIGEPETKGTYATNLWPNGIVPFEFDTNVNAPNRTLMLSAMVVWEGESAVDFRQCANDNCGGDHVHIQDANSNSSPVGRRGGEQLINIVNWTIQTTLLHELGHALGLHHEQNRQDRNGFVEIHPNNICKATDASCWGGFCFNTQNQRVDCDHNFALEESSLTYGAYDFASIMHYGRRDFSRNGLDTITVNEPYAATWQNLIGLSDQASSRDRKVMGCMYPRSNWRWLANTGTGLYSGSCRFPYGTLTDAYSNTPTGGTLWIEQGIYAATGSYGKAMMLTAPNGSVTLR